MPSITALDLNKEAPRSPRETLGGYVVAARTLDKCRAEIAGTAGDYHFDCPLDQLFLEFVGLSGDQFREFVATGADDEAVVQWIAENGQSHTKEEIVLWNNDLRYKRISEMKPELQVFLEDYIAEFIPKDKVVSYWFDVYDYEEGRL
ncbi:DUF5069 domain-containing protein [Roseibacillus ishigakijimensis]|uniref:DUF5069 domain-containing protein n=1 Tax=Roseibacillus ishigakijimensis TaxID=454146 RepID=A0A934RJ93_9BACT|nr:DUF5069 domain-containing protein [Roseibacillus ishigakijimensis]MBK1832439.1 DUF5069 domain-containing protein [Roseibacillus ishigakijimensis]